MCVSVLPQGDQHSPTPCQGILSSKCELFHYVGDTLLTALTEQDVEEAWGSVVNTVREHGWEINLQRAQQSSIVKCRQSQVPTKSVHRRKK